MVTAAKDGRTWRIGTDADVAWITGGTVVDRTITSAIPPVFEAYGTVVLPRDGWEEHAGFVLALLRSYPAEPRWWLGYLQTGSDDVIFPDAPRVTMYAGWHYLLVEAGPDEAARWRWGRGWALSKGPLPDLIFPADRSWLASTLWDDDWTCVGGPAALVDAFVSHPALEARRVELGEDATPPGHESF